MFRFHKTKDIVTLFHKAGSPASTRVVNMIKQASANATEHATEDQANDHSAQTAPHRAEFELNITEDPPTPDQLQTILEYVGRTGIPSVVEGAKTESEAMRLFKKSAESFKRPLLVDWNNGKVVPGDNDSKVLSMLSQLPKE